MSSVRSEYGVDQVVVGEDYLLHYNPAERFDGTSRLIVCTHGHGATASQWLPNHTFIGRHAAALVRTGRYMVLAVSASGGVSWSDPAALASIASGVTYGHTRGAATGKYGIMGYSMGGLTAFNRLKRDSANIAGMMVWAPLTDLTWAHSGVNGTWTTEIETAFGSWANSAGYRVADEPATFTAINVPVNIVHATDDTVVPYSQTTSFLSSVNNKAFTLRQPDVTGGHTALFQSTTDLETLTFFDNLAWT